MKGISLLFIPGLILLAIPFFLPYMEYDAKEFHGYLSMRTRNGISIDTVLAGNETKLSYYPLLWNLISIPSLMLKRTKSSAAMMVISSSVLTIFLLALYFLLTAEPSFYMGYYNVTPLWGYWASFLGSVIFLIGTIHSLKMRKPKKNIDNQLLDDSL
jgi:hypothetical protein